MIENLLEVRLEDRSNFLKIVETLTRIGILSKDNKLTQTCHILHKQGKYYICHFRELFKLDGFNRDVTDEDVARRNAIAKLLAEWNLCEIVDEEKVKNDSLAKVTVIPHNKKQQYTLKSNYTLGSKRKQNLV